MKYININKKLVLVLCISLILFCSVYSNTFTYDELNRLTSTIINIADEKQFKTNYKYDAAGNILEVDAFQFVDCNMDQVSDIDDLVIMSLAYNTSSQETSWDSRADVVKDGKIDDNDLDLLKHSYGK